MGKSKTVAYEIIADFPASMFDIGDTVLVYQTTGMVYMVELDGAREKYDVRDFPHLFKKVENECK